MALAEYAFARAPAEIGGEEVDGDALEDMAFRIRTEMSPRRLFEIGDVPVAERRRGPRVAKDG